MSSFNIRLQRVVDTSPEVAFEHWVDADARRSWYARDEGSTVIESTTDLRVGGSYTVVVVGPTGDPMPRFGLSSHKSCQVGLSRSRLTRDRRRLHQRAGIPLWRSPPPPLPKSMDR
jgi:hypothetical protein